MNLLKVYDSYEEEIDEETITVLLDEDDDN